MQKFTLKTEKGKENFFLPFLFSFCLPYQKLVQAKFIFIVFFFFSFLFSP